MKFLLILVFVIALAVGFCAYNVYTQPQPKLALPLLFQQSQAKLAENLWLPRQVSANAGGPEITAKAALFVDTQTGEVLYAKNEHLRLPIASLTKIMTAIVALEHRQMNDVFSVSEQAANMEPDHMMLRFGEKLTMEELMQGLFLVSANDAAEAIAENTTGRRAEFIDLMNKKAQRLGMNDTYFINPSGLEEDGQSQYSTAYDVAVMARYAIDTFPELVEITKQPEIYIPETTTHQDYSLVSGINLVTTYPGVMGFKTGYTPEAGLTLVTLARKGGHEVVGVLLGTEDRRYEARELLDHSFAQLGVNP